MLVTPSSTADSITTKDDYVFRSCFKDSFQGEMVAAYAKDQGWTKAAVLYATGDTYSSGLHDSFVKAAEKYGIEIVCEQSSSDTGAVDFSLAAGDHRRLRRGYALRSVLLRCSRPENYPAGT